MTRFILTMLFLAATTLHVSGQANENSDKKRKSRKEPEFATQGEQEAYWTQQLFKNDYRKEKHDKFKGKINRLNDYTFQFDTVTRRVVNTQPELLFIFEHGLLQPFGPGLTMSNVEELTELNLSPT